MLGGYAGERRKVFNTSGRDYREQKLGDKIDELSEAQAIALLGANGNLVKRPFLIGPDVTLVGFDPSVWSQRLGSQS